MPDELLPFYNRELTELRDLAADFADAHPKIAGRLRLGTDTVEDPHVSRLIESVAFLNARIRHKLEDDLPELTESFLNVLYPHYLAPVPSMAVAQFECDRELGGSYLVPTGTMIETERVHGEPCYFRTVYPVLTWPVTVRSARLMGHPFEAPPAASSRSCSGILHLELATQIDSVTFSELELDSLQLYLRGDSALRFGLYELILNDAVEVAVATGPADPEPRLLPASSIRPLGFDVDQGMLPYSGRSFLGYRLLTDFFTFPSKFLFFELTDLIADKEIGNRLHVFIYMKRDSHLMRTSDDLKQEVDADSFALGCTPVANLFDRRAEPVSLDQTTSSYHLVPDARRAASTEIYSVNKVTLTRPDDRPRRLLPFFGIHPIQSKDEVDGYWHASRTPTRRTDGQPGIGREMTISVVDPDFKVDQPADGVLVAEVTCFNRDLPHRLPFGGDQPRLRFVEGGGPVQKIRFLTQPTKVVRRSRRDGGLRQLVSHLSLNHLSIGMGEEATRAFQEILRLYDPTGAPDNRNIIDGVLRVRGEKRVLRVLSEGIPGVCRGLEIEIHMDESRFSGSGVYLFASVLERFLALYCSLNSFMRVVATSSSRQGEIRRWAPSTGQKILV